NPSVLQSCILSSSVIFYPSITRNGETYTLENYLNTFLSPASQLNSLIDDFKDAIYSITTIYDQNGLPAFLQIDFTEFRINSSYQIFCKLDFDSFLLNTTDLSIIERPNQFFALQIISKLDFVIEFVSKDLITPNSIFWARNSATDLLSATETTFTTNFSRLRIDNWHHTYDIAGTAGEAKEPGLQNKIFYTQAYHVEKEAFSASTSTLLKELKEKDAKNNSLKVNKACKAAIIIFNEIINTHFGAKLEFRIGFDITKQ
ncbi:125_t:CDS:2, partial [Gigaspora rosea]